MLFRALVLADVDISGYFLRTADHFHVLPLFCTRLVCNPGALRRDALTVQGDQDNLLIYSAGCLSI